MGGFGQLLTDRAIITLSGDRAEQADFLQGLVTNDVRPVSPERAVYAALLTPQGKYLADFLIIERGGNLALDADAAQAAGLLQRLMLYRLRRRIGLSIDEELAVAALWGGAQGGIEDPRHPALGSRVYGAAEELADLLPAPGDYDRHRLSLNIPAAGRDLIVEDTYILEAGFERLHGVDFRKGCYVGQEIVARMKHKTTLRKGLVPVTVEGAADTGETIMAGGKIAGTLRSMREGHGLAHLRLDRAEGPLRAGAATVRINGDPL